MMADGVNILAALPGIRPIAQLSFGKAEVLQFWYSQTKSEVILA